MPTYTELLTIKLDMVYRGKNVQAEFQAKTEPVLSVAPPAAVAPK